MEQSHTDIEKIAQKIVDRMNPEKNRYSDRFKKEIADLLAITYLKCKQSGYINGQSLYRCLRYYVED